MPTNDLKQISKFLSYLLRHNPGDLGLEMDRHGWVHVEDILAKADQPLTRQQIEETVRTSSKQRFSLSADGARIRANQGHSFPVDLGLEAIAPPDILYHGTAKKNLAVILAEGLQPMERQHVHLSLDQETARAVGSRHGKPVVLQVDAARMQAEGHAFFLSANGVWLCLSVPARYLRQ
ncbi:RNA 2'-phosphotransferase [Leisingera sp. ANG-M1]|uniref:RNA 2'-phosphotransferase n=1 Tax=Leisingera sp. ANG-M1 TaxID=1577895 RepID=UPI00057D4F96|nr:RNA 2'-phosphotransferase [Leisingera sp. ANG-M1]KIC12990.1 RNA 2'-phosphotransferase [Leisingera sp. ANG-M1]